MELAFGVCVRNGEKVHLQMEKAIDVLRVFHCHSIAAVDVDV